MNAQHTSAPPLVAVIDDEVDITAFLAAVLADAGYRVVTCNHPGRALETLQRSQPDLICLDLVMPERAGGSLYVALRRDPDLGRVPILILSGLGTREETLLRIVEETAVAPPDGCVDKPLNAEVVLESVGAVLPAAMPRTRTGSPPETVVSNVAPPPEPRDSRGEDS